MPALAQTPLTAFRTAAVVMLYANVLVFAHTVNADELESPSSQPAVENPDLDRARTLVLQLDADSFSDRQKATSRLLKLGDAAVTALNEAITKGQVAARQDALVILGRLERTSFEEKLSALLKDPSPEAAQQMPDWERFCRILGIEHLPPSQNHLENFATILRAEPRLFQLKMFRPRDLPGALAERSADVAANFNDRADQPFPVASCAAMLLLGSDPRTRLPRATSTHISAALTDSRFERLVADGSERETLRALLSEWFMRSEISLDKPLLFTIRHNVAGGLKRARKVVDSGSTRPQVILAILTLGAIGSQSDDISRVEELFEETTVLWPLGGRRVVERPSGQARGESGYTVQTRDVALAVACHLRGHSPADIGMNVRATSDTIFAIDSLGFPSDAVRSEALSRYRKLFSER